MYSILLDIVIVVLLTTIVFYDFKHRHIAIWQLAALAAFFIIAQITNQHSIASIGYNLLINTGFLTLQLLLNTIYFSIKQKSFTNIFNQYFGWGDVWFYIVAGLLFHPIGYILFFLLSLIFALTAHLMSKKQDSASTVPLAGYAAMFLILLIIVKYFIPQWDLFSFDLNFESFI